MRITLTEFIDIVTTSGLTKVNHIKEAKKRRNEKYDPRTDFYKAVREHIQDTHRSGHARSHLDTLLPTVTHKTKISNYPHVIEGYKRWWGTKSLNHFYTPSGVFARHGVEINVNPELGLEWSGRRYIIKLYFKPDKLSRLRLHAVHYLMESVLRLQCQPDDTMCTLDCRMAKLHEAGALPPEVEAMVDAEMQYIAKIWNDLP